MLLSKISAAPALTNAAAWFSDLSLVSTVPDLMQTRWPDISALLRVELHPGNVLSAHRCGKLEPVLGSQQHVLLIGRCHVVAVDEVIPRPGQACQLERSGFPFCAHGTTPYAGHAAAAGRENV